ncbi:uncharacterized protein LOC116352023 [Contarinia nasturtii]|uniref:uncharacterized protein LOC116352023 n=1 Tax=Contarinia nasturtii TaxID=265458 RepID=UPI0012D37D7A|nr:uncharacterized protein LOC116352023 [Contarinia nasturtii]
MFHSKLSTMRMGATAVISSANRLHFAIDAHANGSTSTASHYPCRVQHVLCTAPNITVQNTRNYSVMTKKYTTIERSYLAAFSQLRSISTHEITKHMRLLSEQKRCIEKDETTLRLKTELDKPLVVLFQWLMAKPNHIKKYAQLYIDQGFDVMSVSVTPWQVMWPTKGTQLVAADVVKFLANNVSTKNPVLLHGFSVGAYFWGECMVHMSRDIERYRHVLDNIQGQVWDSAVELSELTIGVPKAVFPKNDTLERALKNYLIYHLKTFHEPATSHYIRSSQMFHSTLVKKPALFLLSHKDPIGSVNSNLAVRNSWESLGIRCDWKCWDKSSHVAHFQRYRDDYINILYDYLQSVNMIQREQEVMRARI